MSRGKLEVTVKDVKAKPPAVELTLEERILEAARKFRSEKSGDVERVVVDALQEGWVELLHKTLGIEKDTWRDRYRFEYGGNTEIAEEFREKTREAARRLLDSIEFETIELTQTQINTIKAAYRNEIKRQVEGAARQLAEEDALELARKVLNLPEA